MIVPVAWIIASYLLGSVPTGLVLAGLKGRDPRTMGSGNIGATNVMRAAGKALGIATLAGDIAKGFFPTWLAIYFGQPQWLVAAAGIAAFAGHLFPVYLRFRGGKGIATALGVFLALNATAVAILVIVFAVILITTRYVSLGSLVGTALMPVLLLLMKAPTAYVLLSLVMAILIVIKHRSNITRLLSGTENKIGKKQG
jgi:glycerol-3-phosphate acyltransferase PlsY